MRIFPAIDLKNGNCVRLLKGNFNDVTEYNRNPVNQALEFSNHGLNYLHIVDLDGAQTGNQKNINSVKVIDCSWHMPNTKRNGFEEYKNQHIPNSIFFDLDANSKKKINLPHMLVNQNEWDKIVSKMGIKNSMQTL